MNAPRLLTLEELRHVSGAGIVLEDRTTGLEWADRAGAVASILSRIGCQMPAPVPPAGH